MRAKKTLVITGVAVVVLAAGSGVAVAASGGADSEAAISGDALSRVSVAALAVTGGGQVTDTEVSDEDSYYEVEVTKSDGSSVDVQLDENLQVIGSAADLPESGDSD